MGIWHHQPLGLFVTVAIFSASGLYAKDKHPKADPQDAIEVVGHIPLTSGPVRRFLATQHYSSYYLYAEHEGGKTVTLIDVTKASRPTVLAEVAYPASANSASGDSPSLSVVAGTAALVTSGPQPAAQPLPQTMRLMDFSDPQHPKVTREFTGITAMDRDDHRGLIFLANADGIWILHQALAEDPEIERAYDYYVTYGMSAYPPPK
jgi:hypothetical protein